MPTVDELKQRQQARELRKAQRQTNVERAHVEAFQLSDVQAQNQVASDKAKAEADEVAQINAAKLDRGIVPAPKPTVSARTTQTRKDKLIHARQADVDAQRMPEPTDAEAEFAKWDGFGQPPLHVLNAIAEQQDRATRDAAKDVANAAGKAAYETYVGKVGVGRNRHARMRTQIAAGEQQIAASKNVQTEE